ncbi:MAG: GyrI-like domain-containing protein, partial [Spirochaetaceae bacterium]|nr:GyrI-like domain-containing protein [Spirochaetaceae bacterium]
MESVKDYKKECRDLYLPKTGPALIDVPELPFAAVEGTGNPNEENGAYQKATELLYGIQYTIKMSKKGNAKIAGYFDYVVPPLEGLWWFHNNEKVMPRDKSGFVWISLIRLPEFAGEAVFAWACEEAAKKKHIETRRAKYLKIREGLCVQCMHLGPYDGESETIKRIDTFITEHGLVNDISETRHHHEIYLSDPRKTEPSKMKTVLRIPVKRAGG